MNKKNVLIHAINGIGLGHIKRTIIIAKELKKLDKIGDIIFVTNSTNPFLIEQEGFKWELLDYSLEDTLKGLSFSKYEKNSFEKICKIVEENNIDIIIHDTFFIKSLVTIKKDIKHFLILRDTELVELNHIKDFLPLFKKVFIPHIKKEFSKEKLKFYSGFDNVIFSSYIIDKIKSKGTCENKIIVSPGYGGDYENTKYFFEYVNKLLISKPYLIKTYKVEFILGKHYDLLKNNIVFNKSFKLKKFINNLDEVIGNYKLFIGRGGYNTINEIVINKINSLIFVVDRFGEKQADRIEFFSKRLGIKYLEKGLYKEKIDSIRIDNLMLNTFNKTDNLELFKGKEIIKDEINKELDKKDVLIFKSIFLPISENFIFEELILLKSINPIIFTLRKENLERFNNNFEIIYNPVFDELLDLEYPKIKNRDLYIKFLKFTISIIKQNNIKVIYTEFLFDAYFIYRLKSIFKDLKIVSAGRGFDVYCFLENNYVNKLDFFSNLESIFVRDKNMKKLIKSYGYHQVDIIRSVLKLEKYKFIEKEFNKLKIIIGGRFTPKKNLLQLLDLVKNLYDAGIIAKIGIVGDGELQKKIISKINDLNLGNIIKMYGFLEHKNLLNIINDYNCFINYSKKTLNGDDEGIPNLILENILSGNLVFSTLTGGISELFNLNENCDLSGNLTKDLKKISLIFENKSLINQVIKANNQKVLKMYNKNNSILKLENKLLKNNE